MRLSSDYAAPIEIDLSVGMMERLTQVGAAITAVAGVCMAQLPGAAIALLILAIVALLWWALRTAPAKRPACLVLYSDGLVACGERADPRAAQLHQVSTYLGLPWVEFSDEAGRMHRLPLVRLLMDAQGHHRFLLWLSAHRPARAAEVIA